LAISGSIDRSGSKQIRTNPSSAHVCITREQTYHMGAGGRAVVGQPLIPVVRVGRAIEKYTRSPKNEVENARGVLWFLYILPRKLFWRSSEATCQRGETGVIAPPLWFLIFVTSHDRGSPDDGK
jgi:hypothetical protein